MTILHESKSEQMKTLTEPRRQLWKIYTAHLNKSKARQTCYKLGEG